jgi:hypothetical protein
MRNRLVADRLRATLVAGALLLSVQAGAQEPPPAAGQPPSHSSEAGEEVEHLNELALVLAGTYEHESEKSYFTFGVEYERRIGRRFGIGVAGEYVTDVDAFILVGTFEFRPVPALKLFAGPGFESKPEEAEEHHEPVSREPGRKTDFLLRMGAGYSVELGGRYSLTPFVAFDLLAGESGRAWVYGVSFGRGF